jgi:hypothetical protein
MQLNSLVCVAAEQALGLIAVNHPSGVPFVDPHLPAAQAPAPAADD